jgi:hypothetical protein
MNPKSTKYGTLSAIPNADGMTRRITVPRRNVLPSVLSAALPQLSLKIGTIDDR